MRFIKSKKGIALLVTLVVAAAAAIGGYAYFSGSGTGNGSAQSPTPASLTITQIGAGYDSLIPNNGYHQDQTYGGAGISDFGNDITLATPAGLQRLTSVVVAFRNWNAAFGPDYALAGVPITLSIVGGPSSTVTPDIAGAQPNGRPTVTNVTFPFNNYVSNEFVYKISFDSSTHASGLNVALSSSANNLSVGTDSAPHNVWLTTSVQPASDNDFPTCVPAVTLGSFSELQTDCGPPPADNIGAYGTDAQVLAGNADIPAVEFNVVGGVATPLYPGGPSQPIDFAITNPGSSGVYVNHVLIAVTGTSYASCDPTWYSVSPGSPGLVVNATIPTGTSFYSPSGASISMTETNTDQSACEGRTINLGFTASGS